MTLFIPSEALGRKSRLLREHIFEEFANTLYFAAASLHLRAIGTSQVLIVLNSDIFEEILKDLHVFGGLAHLHEGSDEDGVVVDLYHIVRPIHVDLHLRFLKLLEFILI